MESKRALPDVFLNTNNGALLPIIPGGKGAPQTEGGADGFEMLLLVVPFALGVLFVVKGAVLPVVTLLLLDPATEVAAADKEDCFNAAA
jgi:hypothetical protein